MSDLRYAYDSEENIFVDMHNPSPDDPSLGTELLPSDVVGLLNNICKETLQAAVALLDDLWNCNCVTDESLGRSKCECEDAPANKSGVRKLMEDAGNPQPGE